MATMRTTLNGNETNGEKKLYFLFRDKFSDDFHIWHNLHIHSDSTEIDFVVIHPSEGIYIIEVKDIFLEKIVSFNQDRLIYNTNEGEKSFLNPIVQARKNFYAIKNGLEKFNCMVHQSGKHKNKLITPVNYGAALPNINSSDIVSSGFDQQLSLNKILDKAFFEGIGYTNRDYEKSLQMLQAAKFNTLIEQDHWNAINHFLGTPAVKDPVSNDIIGVLDDNQDFLVKYKIDKQIIIEGPAGSGKSIVLIKRAMYIHEQNPDWRIGIFCYNAVMSNYLRTILSKEENTENIIISHFDNLSKLGLNAHSLDAILIDEGQDVLPKHLLKINSLLNPETASFTIFHDPRQQLYINNDLATVLMEAGFDIANIKDLVRQQRSVHFMAALTFFNALTNYAQPTETIVQETLKLSKNYFFGLDNPNSALAAGSARLLKLSDHDNKSNVVQQQLANSILIFEPASVAHIIAHFAEFIEESVKNGNAEYRDFYIIFPKKLIGRYYLPSTIKSALKARKTPFRYINKSRGESFHPENIDSIVEEDNRLSADLNENVVRFSNIHQSKGLDAKHIAIIGFEKILHEDLSEEQLNSPIFKEEVRKAASLAYVALSRSTETSHIYFTRSNILYNLLLDIFVSFTSQKT